MGQTLTHGIYLPDEGERNCYNGLAANWSILDGAVGTIADHTTALAGKAPAVHTHVKADITDLFNSANTWSGRNTFADHTYIYGQWKGLYFQNPEVTAGVSPSGDKRNYIAFLDSNGYTLGNITLNVTGANSTWLQTGVSAKDTNDSSQSVYCGTQYRVYGNEEKYFVPATNGDIYLGTSTLQWKSVYARSFNGINPGALSIFNPSATQDPIDVPNTWVTDGSAWNTLNVSNMGDGWICLTYKRCEANDYILVRFSSSNAAYPSMVFPATILQDSGCYLYLLVPVAKAMGNIYLEIKLDSNAVLVAHSFIPSYGTV